MHVLLLAELVKKFKFLQNSCMPKRFHETKQQGIYLYCIHTGWARKVPKTCRRNIWMIPNWDEKRDFRNRAISCFRCSATAWTSCRPKARPPLGRLKWKEKKQMRIRLFLSVIITIDRYIQVHTVAQSFCTHYSCFENQGRFVNLKKKLGILLFSISRVQKTRVIVIQKEKRPDYFFFFK